MFRLTFSAGHIFGFVGPNGAGKTTTMRILATLDDPTDGNAYLDGISIVDDPEQARKFIGFMPDTLPAHRDITSTITSIFSPGPTACREPSGWRSSSRSSSSPTSTASARSSSHLSKGMKQRVSLARALVHDPPCWCSTSRPPASIPGADRATRALERPGRPRQGDPDQFPHPHRARRNLRRRGNYRARAAARAGALKAIMASESHRARSSSARPAGPSRCIANSCNCPRSAGPDYRRQTSKSQIEGGDDAASDILSHLVGKSHPRRRFPPEADGPRRRLHDRHQGRSAVKIGRSSVVGVWRRPGRAVQPDRRQGFRQAVRSRLVIVVLTLFLLVNLRVVGGFLLLSPEAATSETRGRRSSRCCWESCCLPAAVRPLVLLRAPFAGAERRRTSICFISSRPFPGAIIRGKYSRPWP